MVLWKASLLSASMWLSLCAHLRTVTLLICHNFDAPVILYDHDPTCHPVCRAITFLESKQKSPFVFCSDAIFTLVIDNEQKGRSKFEHVCNRGVICTGCRSKNEVSPSLASMCVYHHRPCFYPSFQVPPWTRPMVFSSSPKKNCPLITRRKRTQWLATYSIVPWLCRVIPAVRRQEVVDKQRPMSVSTLDRWPSLCES